MVNLLVDLRGENFDARASARAVERIVRAGFSVEHVQPGSEAFLAWIDERFGGSWSGEAFAGRSIVAKRGDCHAGFATYAPQGLEFAWLRGLGTRPDVGIFGPFGVAKEFRGGPIGPQLLTAALASLAAMGYAHALIPAVGDQRLIKYYKDHSGAQVVERFDRARWRSAIYRAVVLASGNGTNFQSILDGVAAASLPLEIAMLVSNKPSAFALERARRAGVAAVALPWVRNAQTRAAYDAELLELVNREAPDLVLLLGWMHLLPDAFLTAFPHAINIHPAFLPLDQRRDVVTYPDGTTSPAFRGPCAVEDALAWGSRWAGASAHRVTLETDRGPVLARKPMALREGESPEEIMDRLHPIEHRVLAAGIMRWVYER